MAGALKPISQYDYSGGANAVASPAIIGPKQVQRAVNFILDEHGMLRTVPGTHILSTAPVSEAGTRIVLPITWQPVASIALQTLVVVNPLAGGNELYDRATSPWTLLGPFATNYSTPQSAILGDLLLITDDYSTPKVWDSATFRDITNAYGQAPRGGRHTTQHQGFLYLWNTQALTDLTYGGDGPSVLRQSDLNQPEYWNNAQVVFIDKDDGFKGRGLAAFTIAESGIAPFDTLVIFKDLATYQMTGNLGTAGGSPSSNFSLQRVKTDMGNYADRSIQFCAGFGVIRLSHRGFALFDGVDDRLISEEIRPYLFGRDDISPIYWTGVNNSWASQSPSPPIYICFCPLYNAATQSITMTRAFLYDLVRRAWTVVDLPYSIASINLVTAPGSFPQVLLGDAPSPGVVGNIRRWFAGDTTWDGVQITSTTRSRLAFDGSPSQRAYFRRLQESIIADASPVTVTTVVQCSNGITKSSQYILASSPSPIPGVPWELETCIDVTCNSAYYDLTSVGPIRLAGHEFHLRKKPIIGSNTLLGNVG